MPSSSLLNGSQHAQSGGLFRGDSMPWEMITESYNPNQDNPPEDLFDGGHSGRPDDVRLPPQNLQAERCTIGSCLLHMPALDEVLEILTPDHFYAEPHKLIYQALRDMRNAGKSDIDTVTVMEHLESTGRFTLVGLEPLIACMESVPHSAHAVTYANYVLDAARRRKAEITANEILRDTPRKDIPTDDLLAKAETGIHAAMEDSISDQPQSIGDVLSEAIDLIQHGQPAMQTIKTHWTHLDSLIGGVPRGGMVILAARPSQGKSACAMSLALEVAKRGTGVLFSSYEQTRVELAERALSAFSGVDHRRMHRGQLSTEETQTVMAAAGELSAMPIILDTSCRNLTGLATLIRLQVRRRGIQLAIVDYLQLIPPDDFRVNREQQVAMISRKLKLLAMQTGVAVLCLSQLNREVERREDKRPKLSDLRESGAIEQDADHVWFLHRPNFFGTNQSGETQELDDHGILTIAKQRNGPTGELRLAWYPERMHYVDEVTGFDEGDVVFPSDQPELF